MNGDDARDMDDAWRNYLVAREQSDPILSKGWNPRKAFEAGFEAAVVRASGWYGGKE